MYQAACVWQKPTVNMHPAIAGTHFGRVLIDVPFQSRHPQPARPAVQDIL